jgi:uncharacterized membrane protein (TIGR02234 family)
VSTDTVPAPARPVSSRTAAFALLLIGGVAALVASAQAWWRASGAQVSVRFTGSESTAGLSQALPVVVVVGTVLLLVLGVRGRRVVAVLLALLAAGVIVVGALRRRPSPDAVRTQVREVTLADQFALVGTAWPWLYAAAGAVVLAGAVLIMVTVGRWTPTRDRFQRTDAVPPERLVDLASEDPAAVWKAMDAGLDPTVDPGAGPRDS